MGGKTLGDFEAKHGGSRIEQLEHALEQAANRRRPLVVDIPDANNTIRFGIIGDTHVGSVCEAGDEFRSYCARLRSDGIDTILHAGDVLAGWKVYAGQEYELTAIGYAEQRKRFAKYAKATEGMNVYFVTGNHDASLKKLAGVDVGDGLEEVAPGWKCVGEDYGTVDLTTKNGRTYRVRIVHPDGGTSYAISYKSQKQAESLDGGTKPNMLILGHYHKAEHLPSYRNIDVIQAGTFEWQTAFMARKGSAAHVGGWIVRVVVGDKASMSNSVQAEFMAFYRRA